MPSYAMAGTYLAYLMQGIPDITPRMRCPVLTYAVLLSDTRYHRPPFAISGTDLACAHRSHATFTAAPTRCPVLIQLMMLCHGQHLLTYAVLLPATLPSYAKSGTDLAYAATSRAVDARECGR
eukprot:2286022-Rhodomonas_salina.1